MASPTAVVDNNVAVSFLLRNSPTLARLFWHWRQRHFAYAASPPIVDELRDVVARPSLRRRMVLDPEPLIRALVRGGVMTAGLPLVSGACRDPKDDKFLSCALEANADYLVTGDGDLLELDPFRGIRIVTPRAFVEMLDAAEPT